MTNRCKLAFRFSDKVAYISLVVGSLVCFLTSIGIFIGAFYTGLDFAEAYGSCVIVNEPKCYQYIISEYALTRDFVWTVTGLLLTFNGAGISILAFSLFRFLRKEK